MGLAASQGRLLLLTARKSNLELQAQLISQQRSLLSMQQESIATNYSEKTNNQLYYIKPAATSSEKTGEKVPLTVAALQQRYGATHVQVVDTRTGEQIPMSQLQVGANVQVTPDSKLQRNLQLGVYIIKTQDQNKDANGVAIANSYASTWTAVSLAGQSEYSLEYWNDDDAGAKADYDRAMSRVQRLDKQLEIKLNQVETQHKAIETEVESVDKVISNNIEGSFKYFS